MDEVKSPHLGIGIRMVKEFDVVADTQRAIREDVITEAALDLVLADTREGLTFGQKLVDAHAFLRRYPREQWLTRWRSDVPDRPKDYGEQ